MYLLGVTYCKRYETVTEQARLNHTSSELEMMEAGLLTAQLSEPDFAAEASLFVLPGCPAFSCLLAKCT